MQYVHAHPSHIQRSMFFFCTLPVGYHFLQEFFPDFKHGISVLLHAVICQHLPKQRFCDPVDFVQLTRSIDFNHVSL